MTQQSGSGGAGLPVGGVLSGTLPSPVYAGGGSYPPLTVQSATLNANIVMTNANQAYDVLTLTLPAGIWIVWGVATLQGATDGANLAARIWDGTTTYASSVGTSAAAGGNQSVTVTAVITLATQTTIRLTGANAVAGGTIFGADTVAGQSGPGCQMVALRIA